MRNMWMIVSPDSLLAYAVAPKGAVTTEGRSIMRSRNCRNKRVIMVLACLLWPIGGSSLYAVPIIAETGFNDATGINSDGAPNSPYSGGATTLGSGASEPGWTGTWGGWSSSSYFTAQSDEVYEGDLALRMDNPSVSANYSTYRGFAGQTGVFRVDMYVNLSSELNNYFSIYMGTGLLNGDSATHLVFTPSGGIGVADGDGAGGGIHENPGVMWTAGQWIRVTQELDVASQTYRVWFDGQEYVAPDPLNFRYTMSTVDDVRFLLNSRGSGGGSNVAYVDAIQILTPEPADIPTVSEWGLMAMALLVLTAGSVLVMRGTQRRGA